jgi:hypothetical protein
MAACSFGGFNETVFDKPSVVLIGRIVVRYEIEATDVEGGSLIPPDFWTGMRGVPLTILKVNERRKGDPDLARGAFSIDQRDRQRPIRMEFGKMYLLLLDPSPYLKGRPATEFELDPYVFAVRQGGFEILRNGRLRPLEKGGELDEFAGRHMDEILQIVKYPKR